MWCINECALFSHHHSKYERETYLHSNFIHSLPDNFLLLILLEWRRGNWSSVRRSEWNVCMSPSHVGSCRSCFVLFFSLSLFLFNSSFVALSLSGLHTNHFRVWLISWSEVNWFGNHKLKIVLVLFILFIAAVAAGWLTNCFVNIKDCCLSTVCNESEFSSSYFPFLSLSFTPYHPFLMSK